MSERTLFTLKELQDRADSLGRGIRIRRADKNYTQVEVSDGNGTAFVIEGSVENVGRMLGLVSDEEIEARRARRARIGFGGRGRQKLEYEAEIRELLEDIQHGLCRLREREGNLMDEIDLAITEDAAWAVIGVLLSTDGYAYFAERLIDEFPMFGDGR